ncbi:MAG: hypothetical protein IPP14_00010 [Planctomycetes bacterium]|nr:hypothetical protein [Planctomycetota bacterium]
MPGLMVRYIGAVLGRLNVRAEALQRVAQGIDSDRAAAGLGGQEFLQSPLDSFHACHFTVNKTDDMAGKHAQRVFTRFNRADFKAGQLPGFNGLAHGPGQCRVYFAAHAVKVLVAARVKLFFKRLGVLGIALQQQGHPGGNSRALRARNGTRVDHQRRA